jgi:hypothetical protein
VGKIFKKFVLKTSLVGKRKLHQNNFQEAGGHPDGFGTKKPNFL